MNSTEHRRAQSTGTWLAMKRIQAFAYQTNYHTDAPQLRRWKRAALLRVLRRENPDLEKAYVLGVLARSSYTKTIQKGEASAEWIAQVQQEIEVLKRMNAD